MSRTGTLFPGERECITLHRRTQCQELTEEGTHDRMVHLGNESSGESIKCQGLPGEGMHHSMVHLDNGSRGENSRLAVPGVIESTTTIERNGHGTAVSRLYGAKLRKKPRKGHAMLPVI